MAKSKTNLPTRVIHCSWCGKPILPNGPRMRMHESETIRVSGSWLAHFHPDCGDLVLDYCEFHLGRRAEIGAVFMPRNGATQP